MKNEKKKSIAFRLFAYAGNLKIFAFIGMMLSGISSITAILPIYYIWKVAKEVIDVYPYYQNSENITRYAVFALVWACATMAIYLVGLLLTHVVAFRVARNLRETSLNHLLKLPLGFYSSTGSGKLRQLIDECAASTETYLAHNLPDLVGAVISPIAIFGIMFAFDWRLGVISIIPIVLSAFAMMSMIISKDMRNKMCEKLKVIEDMNNEAVEYVRGIPVLKIFNQTIFSFKKFHDAIMRYHQFVCEISTKGKVPMIGFEVLINSSSIFLAIGGLVFIGTETVLSNFLSMFLFGVFIMPLCSSVMYKIMFSGHNTIISENSLSRIEALLNEKPLVYNGKNLKTENFDISFENVDFSYPNNDKLVIDNLNLEIKQGETYGFVGPSGGGKTTLLTLIPRFFDVKNGSIKIGGVDIRDMEHDFLMSNISFVFQQTKLYKKSIFENVRESKPNATKDEVLKALELAQCMEFVSALPQGIDTVYGTKGTYLSGGQAQRIAIARAILKDAPIILLDEATSFTDPENEFEIKKSFDELTKGKTVLMIAHRLSSVQNADKICYIDKGKITEIGSHQELLDKNGQYASLWQEYQCAFNWKKEVTK